MQLELSHHVVTTFPMNDQDKILHEPLCSIPALLMLVKLVLQLDMENWAFPAGPLRLCNSQGLQVVLNLLCKQIKGVSFQLVHGGNWCSWDWALCSMLIDQSVQARNVTDVDSARQNAALNFNHDSIVTNCKHVMPAWSQDRVIHWQNCLNFMAHGSNTSTLFCKSVPRSTVKLANQSVGGFATLCNEGAHLKFGTMI